MGNNSKNPQKLFSIVVCTHNRADLIKPCIESLQGQDYPKAAYEIIVVDDGSTDETPAVVQSLARNQPKLVILREECQGPALARNRGVQAAQGEFLLFLDDDAQAPPTWLQAIDETFRAHPEIQGLGSHTFLTFASGSLDKRQYWNQEGEDALMPLAFEPQKWLSTHNLALKRSAFESIQGFLPETICHDEDLDLLYRLLQKGHKLLRTSRTVIFHKSRERLADILRQQLHFGNTDVFIFRRFFPNQLVVDFQAGRLLGMKDFYCLKAFPFNCCLRLDFFKGFLLSLLLLAWSVWFPLAYLALLWLGIIFKVKRPWFAVVLLRTLLARDAAYLLGHLKGSWQAKAIYF